MALGKGTAWDGLLVYKKQGAQVANTYLKQASKWLATHSNKRTSAQVHRHKHWQKHPALPNHFAQL
jgi:hypothetical protein